MRARVRAYPLSFPTTARLLLPVNGLFVAQSGGELGQAVWGEGYRMLLGHWGTGPGLLLSK